VSGAAVAPWETVHTEDGLVVQSRARPGSAIAELRAEGAIAAPPAVVRAVVADVERYPEFMPYVKVSRVLARDSGGDTVVYQRLSFGALRLLGVGDRDYVIRITEQVLASPTGQPVFRRRWNLADAAGAPPPEDSVIRLAVDRGLWELGPADPAGTRTRAIYCLFTDPGGSLPAWVANQANRTGIPDVFAAVRKAATDPRYAGATAPVAASAPLPDARDACDAN
jgi:polyketide cyclase/dehydrase/lipid transport protein